MFLYVFNFLGLFVVAFLAASPIAIPLSLVYYYRDERMVKKYVDPKNRAAGYRMSHTHPVESALYALFRAYAISLGVIFLIIIVMNVF